MQNPSEIEPSEIELKYAPILANGTDEEKVAAFIAVKIVHILTHFPKLSHSMLQIALGTLVLAKDWRPILDEMIVENEVKIETVHAPTPTGRQHTYSIISLVE